MDLKVSSSKRRGISPSNSDSEEKEFSDDNDDDRNHKHRRREMHSQSSQRDVMDQAFSRPFRKQYKPYKNVHPFRETDSMSSEGWKEFNNVPMEKDLSTSNRGRPGFPTFFRAPMDLNQRLRAPPSFLGDSTPGRGRGRDSWSRGDFRFRSVDVASQVVHQGSFPPSLFPGRGLPNVTNTQIAPWNAFGYTSGLTIDPSMNLGISRQRCRDFEERGFCLRGDMCPMEHGVNRIVVEDVQSLSQFNLPVSLPSGHVVGTSAGAGSTLSITAPGTTSMSSKALRKSDKPEMVDIGLGLDCPFPGSSADGDADLYDPDQPLLNNDQTEPSSQLLALNASNMDEPHSLMDRNLSDQPHTEHGNGIDVGSQGTRLSVWGSMHSSKSRPKVKRATNSGVNLSDQLADTINEDRELLTNVQGIVHQDRPTNTEDITFRRKVSRKPSQKATRTLFVNGIPEKINKKEALLLHFKKFGEVIDMYIPSNTQRAFVQFSRREEAEAALKSPDAVMGNRFIKLWWANRDNIPDGGTSNPPVEGQGKDWVHYAPRNITNNNATDVATPSADLLKPVITSLVAAPQPTQKKLENLEILKEELRKKQEILDQKRNEFKLQLRKLEKQASGIKNEEATEQPMKRHKAGTTSDFAKATTPTPSDADTLVASPRFGRVLDKKKVADNGATHSSSTTSALVTQEPTSLKQPIRPSPPATSPFSLNRFKLDNRPTAFRITPPLPAGLANVSLLKEHFSSYGDLSHVELENQEMGDESNVSGELKNCSARVTFISRPSAEKAFKSGNCWEGHNLQFTWLTSKSSTINSGFKQNSLSTPKEPIDVNGLHEVDKAGEVPAEKVVSESVKVDNLERAKNYIDLVEPDKDVLSNATTILLEKESLENDGDATNVLRENNSPKDDGDATTSLLEKKRPKDDSNATSVLLEKESLER